MNNSSVQAAFQPFTLPFSIIAATICMFGAFGNGMIIAVTWLIKSPQLNTKSNQLIALLAVSDLICNIGMFQIASNDIFNLHGMSQCMCFWYLCVYVFALNTGSFMIAVVGIDRMCALVVPIKYKSWSTRPYVRLAAVPAIMYGLSTVIAGAISADCTQSVPYCMPPTAFTGNSLDYWIFSNIFICVSVVIIYSVTLHKAMKLGFGGEAKSTAEKNKQRTLQSLFIIMFIYSSTWFATVIILNLITVIGVFQMASQIQARLLGVSPSLGFYIALYVGIGSAIVVSCNGYVYAIRSTEYRAAFKKLLCIHNNVNPTNVVIVKDTKQVVATVQTTKI